MNVYFVAIILTPTAKQKHDDGAAPTVALQPTAVVAKDQGQAIAKAMKKLGDEFEGKEDRLEVFILPFVKA